MEHQAKSIRSFIGAKNFEESRNFYHDWGFEEIILSKYNKIPEAKRNIRIKTFGRIDEVFEYVMG